MSEPMKPAEDFDDLLHVLAKWRMDLRIIDELDEKTILEWAHKEGLGTRREYYIFEMGFQKALDLVFKLVNPKETTPFDTPGNPW